MMRRTNALNIFDRAAEPIFKDTFCAGLTREPVIESQLETFLALVVNIGKSDQMSDDFACWIIASVFTLYVDARQVERHNLPRFGGTKVTLQIQKFFVGAECNFPHQEF